MPKNNDNNPPEEERCSFCGKPRSMVDELFEGPGGNVRICDQCIGVCNIMMAGRPNRNMPPMPENDPMVNINSLIMESADSVQDSRKSGIRTRHSRNSRQSTRNSARAD